MPSAAWPMLVASFGIDLGLIDFATLSDGSEPIPAPKFFRKAQRKLRKAQRTVSRRKPWSKRKAKARIQVARIHRKTATQRNDFLHKLTTALAGKHDGLCIEDLSVKGLARTKLAKSVTDASWGEFRRQLEYKCAWNRKPRAVIDRWFPSSKRCNVCGAPNGKPTCISGGIGGSSSNRSADSKTVGSAVPRVVEAGPKYYDETVVGEGRC